ncbi:hypothetical protein C7C46_29775 [Streptomyces tateyamensis]|uniref:Uncharacterized protein n=1 Tax=Streptomyces tateyamensis TaxID=565073 RepID=A0A2V4N147_9ACTN|nr:hypothetical protein [Streptomyces tateyamensis]PYC68043.1 hypothetical protein C7C46_29775 [Streptomyces tateyamensis]
MSALDSVRLLGADQQHIVTRAQLIEHGVPSGTIAHRLRPGGPWQRVLPRVICLQSGRLSAHQRLRAAVSYAAPKGERPRPGAVLLTGLAVLAEAGLASAGHPADVDVVDVLIPNSRRVASRDFVRVHRAPLRPGGLPAGFQRDDGLWSVGVGRALADAAPYLGSSRHFRALCAEAVQGRHCEQAELLARLLGGSASTAALPHVQRVADELTCGIYSVAESEAREVLRRGGLPEPLWNPVLLLDGRFLAIPDAFWPQACVALEVDSRAWHLRPADYERTLTRGNRLQAARLPVVRATPHQLRTDAGAVLRELRTLLTTGPHGPWHRVSWTKQRI